VSLWGSIGKFLVNKAAPVALDRLGTMGQGASAGRANENAQIADSDRTRLLASQLEQKDKMDLAALDLKQREFEQNSASNRARQTVLGDVMARMQQVNATRPDGVAHIEFAGGLSPALLGDNSRAAGAELSNQALAALMRGEQFDPMERTSFEPAPRKEAGLWEKVLNGAGVAGGLVGALDDLGVGARPKPLLENEGESVAARLALQGAPGVESSMNRPLLPSRNPVGTGITNTNHRVAGRAPTVVGRR
jgi:hypothetical protein